MDEHTTSEGWIKEGLSYLQVHHLFPRVHTHTLLLHFPLSLVLGFSCPLPHQLLSISHFTLHPAILSIHLPPFTLTFPSPTRFKRLGCSFFLMQVNNSGWSSCWNLTGSAIWTVGSVCSKKQNLEGNPEAKLRHQGFSQKANRSEVEKMNPWHQTR